MMPRACAGEADDPVGGGDLGEALAMRDLDSDDPCTNEGDPPQHGLVQR